MKLFCLSFLLLCACSSVHAQSSQKILNDFLDDSIVRTGFAGVALYDPAAKKYIVDYNAEKNFLPSSNVKLFTLYAGMKYLGDSITGMKIKRISTWRSLLYPTGDPTFLHDDFSSQPVLQFIQRISSYGYSQEMIFNEKDNFNPLGEGWAWDDRDEEFMAERNRFPVHGNIISITINPNGSLSSYPKIVYNGGISWYEGLDKNAKNKTLQKPEIFRSETTNWFWVNKEKALKGKTYKLPFTYKDYTDVFTKNDFDLSDTLHQGFDVINDYRAHKQHPGLDSIPFLRIRSRPADSLFRPMMFNSDNFFAEQTLLMVSDERLGYMSDKEIIDSLLQKDFKNIPTKPRWIDGSGLSRYNLFSPKDFVYILEKTEKEFGWQRLKNILPTAGQGTLKGYYENLSGLIYAKTGSMSNNVSLSGFIYGKSGKKLIFSVIINNFSGSGRSGRKAIEQLLLRLREIN